MISSNNNNTSCQQQQQQPIHLPAGAVDPVLNLVAQRIFELSLRQQRHQQCFITAQAQAEMTSLVSQYPSVAQQLYGGRQSRQYPLLNVLQWQPSLELVQQLVEAFPAALLATENGFRPLDLACWKNAPLQVVQYLHQQDSTAVSTLCQGVVFPLHIALHHFNSNDNNSEEVVQFLLDQYPQAASQPDAFGKLPLHHAAASGVPLSILQRLVSLGPQASTRQQDKQGWTPLHYACRHGRQQNSHNNAAVVAFLMQQDQQQTLLMLPNQNGNTPLDLAAMYQTPAVLQFLLSQQQQQQQQQAEPEQDEEPHITLLHLAARCNQADSTQFLAERYPWMLQVVSPCSQNTPLHYACERDDDAVEVVRVLTTTAAVASLRHNMTNNDNKLPLCLARDNRNRQVVRLLAMG